MRASRLGIGIVVLALAIAGCGGGEDAAPAGDKASLTAAQPEVTRDKEPPADDRDATPEEATEDAPEETDDAPASGPVDMCEIVSAEEVSGIIGADVTGAGDQEGTCTFESATMDLENMRVVVLVHQRDVLMGEVSLRMLAEMTAGDGAEPEMVDGIGDEAFSLAIVGVPSVYFADGADLVSVTVLGAENLDSTLELAGLVADRL